MKKVKNYARFFALIKSLPGDHEEMKENLVSAFTGGRTRSLREMEPDEYRRMCDSLEESRASSLSQKDFTNEIKRKRSAVLKRIQALGIDTLNWAAVDEFCLNPRIAGKVFRQLSLDDLKRMIPKLEAIARKPFPAAAPQPDPVTDPAFINRMVEMARNQIPN